MENESNTKKRYVSYSDYVSGNAVRKINVQPERETRTYVDNKRVKISRNTFKNREKELRMSAPYVILLAGCLFAIAFMCIQYLKIYDGITTAKKNIASTEIALQELKSQNDSLDYTINSFVDVENISKIATEQLGMVRASQSQISFYKSSESEYMKQFNNVPQD